MRLVSPWLDPGPTRLNGALSVLLAPANPGDAFELDGNAEDSGADSRPDWNSINCLAPDDNGGALTRVFIADPAPMTIFTTGGSKDINDVSQWMHTNGNVPDKDDITNAYAAAYLVDGDLILAFGADRFANNGDAAAGFWFFQNEISLNPDGTFSGTHAVGDILIISRFTQGGGDVEIRVYEWVGSGGSHGALDNITDSAVGAVGLVNGTTNFPCWPYVPKFGTPGEIPEGSFIEGAINLTAFGFDNLCLSSFLAETRSSQEPTAQLKDFALGNFSTQPDADAGADQALCSSSEDTVFNISGTAMNAAPATPAWTVVSQDPSVTSVTFGDANAADTTVTITGTGTATLRFTVTSTLGCGDAFDDVDVTVNPNSMADAGPDQELCDDGGSTSFTVEGTASNGTIQWSVVDQDLTVTGVTIDSPNSAVTDVTIEGTGSATLRLTVSNLECGEATDDVVLTVNPNPVCSITGDNEICEGESTEFCGPDGMAFYSWSGPDGFLATTQCTGAISVAGVYTLTVTDGNGCVSICEETLTVNPLPICEITGDNGICTGDSTEFCGPTGMALYSWTGPDGFTASTQCTGPISVAGLYSLTITDENGCSSTCDRTLTVNPPPICEITGDNEICAGDSTEFCGPAGMAVYSWTGPDGFTASTQCTGPISVAGVYTLTITDENGCSSTCDRTLTVNPLPVCSITGDNIICDGDSTEFCGPAGMAVYSWTGPNGFTASTQCTGPISVAGLYSLTITDQNGCTSTCEQTLVVNPNPICSINTPVPVEPICGTSGNIVSALAGQGAYFWSFDAASQLAGWSVDSGQGTNAITYTAGAAAGTATLTLVITNEFGCTSMCSIMITCLPPEMEFCTLTQGAYGNPNGSFNGVRRVQLITNLLDLGPITIGDESGNYITFSNTMAGDTSTAECIISLLPAGGKASALPDGTAIVIGGESGNDCSIVPVSLLRKGKFGNVLIGQVLTLSLNLRLDPNHPLADHHLCAEFLTRRALPGPDAILGNDNDVVDPNDPGSVHTIPQSVIDALCALDLPLTVEGLLELANRALAGLDTGGASLAAINDAVSAINEGFDECRFLIDCTPAECPTASDSSYPNATDMVSTAPSRFGFTQVVSSRLARTDSLFSSRSTTVRGSTETIVSGWLPSSHICEAVRARDLGFRAGA